MAIEGIKIGTRSLEQIQGGGNVQSSEPKGGGTSSFADMFTDAVKDVDKMQQEAEKQIEGLVLGKDGVTTHDAMIALEKADVAFQLMNSIRGKIVRAYEQVMRTQV